MAKVYTITNSNANSAVVVGNSIIPAGGSVQVNELTSDYITALNAGKISISPAVGNVTSLTDSTTGTASVTHTLVDVTATPTQALINDNFATVAASNNAIIALLNALAGELHSRQRAPQ